jgi:outer membrane protein OmpA-like peptidoglycan-associated protein
MSGMRRRSFLSLPLCLSLVPCACTSTEPPRRVVFFSPNSAAVDDPARTIIQEASAAAKANPSARVLVLGFASPETGTVESNKALAQARAQTVADGLVAAGVPQARIHVEPWGAIAYGLTPMESRRVEIVIGQ